MNLLDILRCIRGYVHFTAEGGFPERFINLCASRGIHLWTLTPQIKKLEGCVSAKDFFRLRAVARKSGVRLTVNKKCGLPFFMKRHRNRAFLFAGVFIYIFTVIAMNQFVWFIDVEGTHTVSHARIISTLEQYGLKKGVYSKAVDTDLLNREGVNSFNGRLMWMSVNIKGSKAVIEVRDYVDEHEDATYKEPCNIVADFDATVLSVEAFNGVRIVRAGNAVKKGDLLISGVVENTDFSASYLEARGRITALHTVSRQKAYSAADSSFKRLSDRKKTHGVNFLWLTFPKSDKYFSYNEFLEIKNTVLPFGIIAATKKEYTDNEVCDYAILTAIDSYTAEFYRDFANTNILSSDTKISLKGTECIITSEMNCIDFIGIKSPIYIDKE